MGNKFSLCLLPRVNDEGSPDNFLFSDVLSRNNPISAAIHMISAPSEEESIGMALILSNNVASVANSDQTENGLKFLLEYLQLSLPMDSPLSGSITSLIIKEASLPSRSFLREVSTILKLPQKTQWLDEYTNEIQAKTSNITETDGVINVTFETISQISMDLNTGSSTGRHNFFMGNKNKKIDPKSNKSKVDKNLLQIHNACLIIDCLATRICGPNSMFLLNDDIIRFLVTCCNLSLIKDISNEKLSSQFWTIVLRSILCFEKFALTKACKDAICDYFTKMNIPVPFCHLEALSDSNEMIKREVGFCSQWLLDNTYTIPNRIPTYKVLDRTNLNAIMNIQDASQYIKLSPIGLEVRCDSDSFESVRCTMEVISGVFYYEAKLITGGIMQIGWATKRSQYMNHEGRGIGDDLFSIAYDGCRRVIWYNGVPHKERILPKWKPGDILGCLINLNKRFILFSVNGKYSKKQIGIFNQATSGFYAGASFLNNQQCLFNFGREKFQYPPSAGICGVSLLTSTTTSHSNTLSSSTTNVNSNLPFSTFNDAGSFEDEDEKIVYPRIVQLARMITGKTYCIQGDDGNSDDLNALHILLQRGGSISIDEENLIQPGLCQICYSASANAFIDPCHHKGFCRICLTKCDHCPLCRTTIKSIKSDPVPLKASSFTLQSDSKNTNTTKIE